MKKLVNGELVDLTPEEVAQREAEQAALEAEQPARQQAQIDAQRASAYAAESDPLFFKWQRGESTEQAWLDKVAEIRERYPDVTE